ncbi:MAG TPA: hypothetical protein VK867_10215 [Candidatus Limnocylindrales bacterium]|nr:hypothetical protein [Candidatus Limnocylindrales bacterium]
MRLVTAAVTALTVAAISQVAIHSASARGVSVVAVAGGEGESALEWDVVVDGGTPSTDHVTLAPIAGGFEREFTVAVELASATVTLTTVLPADRELASVRCLDDLFPRTDIDPVVARTGFTFEIVPGRRYRCFAASAPIGSAGASVQPTHAAADLVLPRSDASMTSPSMPAPGWPAVLVTLIAILGIALVLRPGRR